MLLACLGQWPKCKFQSFSPLLDVPATQQQRAGVKSWHTGDGRRMVAPAWLQGEGHPEKHPSSYCRPRSDPGRDFPHSLSRASLE